MSKLAHHGCRRLGIVAQGSASHRPRGGASSTFEAPARLAGTPTPENHTAYTLRLSTGVRRGAALTDSSSAVLVCLVGQDGTSVLRRIPVLVDPKDEYNDVRHICEGVDHVPPPGADCTVALPAASRRFNSAGNHPLARRFQEGAVDELSFLAPDLGPLAGVLVGPESGTWYCEELDISSSRTGQTDRFVCRDQLGHEDRPATFLPPVPVGGVVYGAGDAAVVLTKEEAARLRAWDMQGYSVLKGRLLIATAALAALGTATAAAAGGTELAFPFALGGLSSLFYQYLLQRRVDKLSPSAHASLDVPPSQIQPGPGLRVGLALSNPAVRAALMAGGLVGSLALVHMFAGMPELNEEGFSIGTRGERDAGYEVKQVAAGVAGFFMHKVAVVWVSCLPASNEGFEEVVGDASKRRKSGVDDKVE